MNQGIKKCPICQTWLKQGERVYTEAFPGKGEEKIVYLHDCPYCRNKLKANRKCPICKKKLPPQEYLIGTMWKQDVKIRVHISCCSICGRKKILT